MINWTDILSAIASVIAVIVSIWAGATAWQAHKDTKRVNDIMITQFHHAQFETNITWEKLSRSVENTPEGKIGCYIAPVQREDIIINEVTFSQYGKDITNQANVTPIENNIIKIIYPREWFAGLTSSNIVVKISWTYTKSGYRSNQVIDFA